jgi:hypothetical protein
MPVNDLTPNLALQLPHPDNFLEDDSARLRSALLAIDAYLNSAPANDDLGAPGGIATLDGAGKVPAAQLPSFVDDVLEFASLAAFPVTGESGKIYIALDFLRTYRWGGTAYTEISGSPGSTDVVPEGSVNLYFTAARARAAQVPATLSAVGVVKPGVGLQVAPDGTLNVTSNSGQLVTFVEGVLPVGFDGQDTFTVPGGYISSLLEVYVNGAKLYPVDFVATNGSGLVLAQPLTTADELLYRSWRQFNIGDLQSSNITDATTLGRGLLTAANAEAARVLIDAVSPSGTVASALTAANAGTAAALNGPAADGSTATTQAAKDATTKFATTAFVDRLRGLLSSTTTGTAVVSDRGCGLHLTSGFTLPSSIFASRDTFTLYNDSSAAISLIQGAGLTLRLAGTAGTGDRTLAQRGLATVYFVSPTEAVISGAGLT